MTTSVPPNQALQKFTPELTRRVAVLKNLATVAVGRNG
jgi:hypothetical protein